MFFLSIGMFHEANITILQFITNISFVTLGNIIGGVLLVGCGECYLYSLAEEVDSSLDNFGERHKGIFKPFQ
jgi:formate/nitrite transporter FocA (FNT family)